MIKTPFDLKCEYLTSPIGIDTQEPRFSWILNHEERSQKQSAYQIIVSSTSNLSNSGDGDIWDSEKVVSENNCNIKYKGIALKSNCIYYWRVRWWDKHDVSSSFSDVAKFETSLLNEEDWKAKWITRQEFTERSSRRKFQYRTGEYEFRGRIREYYAVYLRKEFNLSKPIKKAKAYICGLGHYELRINGKKIGNRILEPAWTDYNKIALYSTYDVTQYIQYKNAIAVILGNGRHIINYGYEFPKLILQLEIEFSDGTSTKIVSNNSWKISQGPILENGIFFGEKYDARLELPGWDKPDFNDSNWINAVYTEGPPLSSQLIQPIRITEKIKPINLYSPENGIYVYDFGQNFTGFVRIRAQGPRGAQITLRFAEIVYEDGTINTATNGTAKANDIFILKGEGVEMFEPHFTYHGFRYVEVNGFPGVPTMDTLEGLFFHTDARKTSKFYCSNNLINQIHENIIWGQYSNMMSIPTDCPQRSERQGWMGDAQLTVEECIFNFDSPRFYIKYLRDIKLSQREDGQISDVVPPYWLFYPADPAWGTAYITIVWYLYWYYNDIEIIKQHYNSMKLYVEYLSSISKDNILYMGKYGDWCPPSNIVSRKTPIEFTSTWYYYHDMLHLSKFAKIIGKNDDFDKYSGKANEIKDAFNQKFLKAGYDVIKHSIVDGTIGQTLNVLPLYLKMVPENRQKKVISTLIGGIKNNYDYHVDTGIVGTRYLFDVLTEYGYPEVAYKMITQKSFPGYGYMIKEGATTLWERWEKLEGSGINSHNHIMLGSVDTWFFKTLAGINSNEQAWKRLKIKPFIPDDMDYATATLKTIRGIIHVSWEKDKGVISYKINIPVGSSAEIWIQIENEENVIKEGDTIIWENYAATNLTSEIEFKEIIDNYVVFNVGSGYYQFSIR